MAILKNWINHLLRWLKPVHWTSVVSGVQYGYTISNHHDSSWQFNSQTSQKNKGRGQTIFSPTPQQWNIAGPLVTVRFSHMQLFSKSTSLKEFFFEYLVSLILQMYLLGTVIHLHLKTCIFPISEVRGLCSFRRQNTSSLVLFPRITIGHGIPYIL